MAVTSPKNTLYIMGDRERLKGYLEEGYKKPPSFINEGGIPRFEYPVHEDPHQFKTYAVWMKIVPIDEEKREDIRVECLVPFCGSHITVAYANSALSITNWLKHSYNNHANVLTKKDYDAKQTKSDQKDLSKKRKAEDSPRTLTDDAEKEAISELICINGLPLSFADSPGWIQYCKRHGMKWFSRRTITSFIEALANEKVIKPRNTALMKYFSARTVFVLGTSLMFRLKCSIGTDGMTDMQGRQMESLVACFADSVNEMGSIKMVPRPWTLSLDHFKLTRRELPEDLVEGIAKGLYYDADEHADFFVKCLASIKFDKNDCITPGHILKVNTDTTYGQPAMIERIPRHGGVANLDSDITSGFPQMTGSFYSECVGHTINLQTQDLLKCSMFSASHKAVNELSVWIRGSDKRVQVFLQAAQALRQTVRKPVSFPVTRFFYAILQMKILSDGYEVLQYMYDNATTCFGNDNNTTSSAFNELFSAFKANHPFVVSIVKLFEKQLSIAPKMGAARRYTNSLPSAYVKTILDHVEKFKVTAEGQRIPTIVDQYVCSLFNRISSISLVELALKAGKLPDSSQFKNKDFFTRWKTTNQYIRRVYRDDIVNAAAYLDPAVFPIYDSCGHNVDHALTFYVRLLKGCLVVDNKTPEIQPAHDQSNMHQLRAQFNARKSKITKKTNTEWSVTQAAFDAKKKDEISSLVSEFRLKGLKLEAEDYAIPEIEDDKSTEEIIEDQIRLELASYKGIMSSLLAGKRDYFGNDIFENNCSERYTFWPLHEKKLPLLYLCAVMLLGTTLTAMENERFHSAVSFIHSKLRSSLSVQSVERLTLCKIYLADALKDQEISLANELAIIEAIDDGNDVTS